MPNKRNPAGCAISLAAATRLPGLVAAFLTGMVQEHERAVGGWHAEWPTIAAAIQTTGSALAAMVEVMGGLSVNVDRTRANIERSNGAIFAERVTMLLIPSVGREAATRFVIEALNVSRESGQTFVKGSSVFPTSRDSRGRTADHRRAGDHLGVAGDPRADRRTRTPEP